MPVSAQTNSIHALSPSHRTSRQLSMMLPFSRLYLTALVRMFISMRFIWSGLPISLVCGSFLGERLMVIPRSSALCSMAAFVSSRSSGRSKLRFSRTTSHESSLPKSRTSFTSTSSSPGPSHIYFLAAACFSRSPLKCSPISTMPRIPFIGVRISWLMR